MNLLKGPRFFGLIVGCFAGLLVSAEAEAGTTQTYQGQCRYKSTDGEATYAGACEINAGIVGPGYCGAEYFFERFILTLPGNQEVWIYTRCDGTGIANGIGSIARKRVGAVDLVLTNGETFSFTDESEWACTENCAYYYPELNKNGAGNRPDKSEEPAVKKLISLYWDLNSGCRGGSGDKPETWEFCDAREKLYAAIKTYGICSREEFKGNIKEVIWFDCEDLKADDEPIPSFFFGAPLPVVKPE